MSRHFARRLLPVLVVMSSFGLAGCESFMFGGGNVAPLAVIEGATIVTTKKGVGDHLYSWSTGKNCSTVRSNLGMHYCEEDEPADPPAPYCYRTLGAVTCYDQPDPSKSKDSLVGRNEIWVKPQQ